jgi:hypothetical protein
MFISLIIYILLFMTCLQFHFYNEEIFGILVLKTDFLPMLKRLAGIKTQLREFIIRNDFDYPCESQLGFFLLGILFGGLAFNSSIMALTSSRVRSAALSWFFLGIL